jgi:hypothetical protein
MYERIVTFAVGLLIGVIGTFAVYHRAAQRPADVSGQISVQSSSADKSEIIRQANETQSRYLQQVNDLKNERAALLEKNSTAAQQIDALNKLSVAWQNRTDTCEAKFQTGTIISEPRPLGSLPIGRGLFSLSLSAGDALAGAAPASPVIYVPAQVQVTSRIPGVTYLWIDPQGGAVKGGPFAATIKQ